MKIRIIATAAAAALLIAAVPIPAVALDLGGTVKKVTKTVSRTVSGLSGGGSSAGSSSSSSGSTGSTSSGGDTSGGLGVTVPLLGGSNLNVDLLGDSGVAGIGVENERTGARTGVSVLSGFQLSSLGLDSGAVAQPSTADGRITVGFARALYENLDRLEQQALTTRCGSVLRSPKAFGGELVQLCRILGSL
jgi:hypothetical protein